jgi:hypothetical protein
MAGSRWSKNRVAPVFRRRGVLYDAHAERRITREQSQALARPLQPALVGALIQADMTPRMPARPARPQVTAPQAPEDLDRSAARLVLCQLRLLPRQLVTGRTMAMPRRIRPPSGRHHDPPWAGCGSRTHARPAPAACLPQLPAAHVSGSFATHSAARVKPTRASPTGALLGRPGQRPAIRICGGSPARKRPQ